MKNDFIALLKLFCFDYKVVMFYDNFYVIT